MANQNAAQLIDDIWMTGREDIILVPTGKSGGFMVRPGDFGTYGAYMVRGDEVLVENTWPVKGVGSDEADAWLRAAKQILPRSKAAEAFMQQLKSKF